VVGGRASIDATRGAISRGRQDVEVQEARVAGRRVRLVVQHPDYERETAIE
jgi:hypothetical protein